MKKECKLCLLLSEDMRNKSCGMVTVFGDLVTKVSLEKSSSVSHSIDLPFSYIQHCALKAILVFSSLNDW